MKALNLVLIALLIFSLLQGCKNVEPNPLRSNVQATEPSFTIDHAKEWFDAIISKTPQKNLNINGAWNKEAVWKYAVIRNTMNIGQTVIVPIKYKTKIPIINPDISLPTARAAAESINFAARLVIWKNRQGAFEYRVHHLIPDASYRKKNGSSIKTDLSGIVLITNFDGNFIEGFKYEEGKKTRRLNTVVNQARVKTCFTFTLDWYSQVCVDDYCYTPIYTYTDIYMACEEGDHGADGYTPPPSLPSPTIVTNYYESNGQFIYQIYNPGPDVDIREYLKCFGQNSDPNGIYRVVIYVDQVWPYHRSYNLNSSNSSPGHVFIGLEEYTNGEAIIRNVGFYPQNGANPFNPSDQGEVRQDDRGYDVSLTVTFTEPGQFMSIVTALSAAANAEYNINSNNCTHYAINACSSNGINLPQTIGSWWNGGGLNPSDLGEDIRSMTLSPNMTRNPDGGYPSAVTGSCN